MSYDFLVQYFYCLFNFFLVYCNTIIDFARKWPREQMGWVPFSVVCQWFCAQLTTGANVLGSFSIFYHWFCSEGTAEANTLYTLKDWKRWVNKVQTQGHRPQHTNSGYSKELNVQNVSYLMEFSSCSEKRSCLIFFRKLNWYTLRFFKQEVLLSLCSFCWFFQIL